MNSKRQTLLDLAARVEGLDGPSREVDHLIRQACFEHGELKTGTPWWIDSNDRTRTIHETPIWTASLDAAMQLVPRGWQVEQVGEWYDDVLRLKGLWLAILVKPMHPIADGGSGGCADPFARCQHAATAALALTAAALRARAMMEPQDEN